MKNEMKFRDFDHAYSLLHMRVTYEDKEALEFMRKEHLALESKYEQLDQLLSQSYLRGEK